MNDVPNAVMVADKDAGAVFYLFFPDQFIREYDLYKCIYNFFKKSVRQHPVLYLFLNFRFNKRNDLFDGHIGSVNINSIIRLHKR